MDETKLLITVIMSRNIEASSEMIQNSTQATLKIYTESFYRK